MGLAVASWSEDDGYVVVDGSGSWEDVPTGNLGWARMLTFEGPIGPVPADRAFPRTWSLEGRSSEHVHEWADLPRLRAGGVGAQFWSVYVPASLTPLEAVQATFEQIDTAKRIIAAHPDAFGLATTADEVDAVFASGRIASLIGLVGASLVTRIRSVRCPIAASSTAGAPLAMPGRNFCFCSSEPWARRPPRAASRRRGCAIAGHR